MGESNSTKWLAVLLIILAVFTIWAYGQIDKQKNPVVQETKSEQKPLPKLDEGNPNVEVLEEMQTSVSTAQEAKEVFEDYVQENEKDWDFVSVEEKTVDGKDYYEVTYRQYEISGGKRRVLIDSTGAVLQQYPILG